MIDLIHSIVRGNPVTITYRVNNAGAAGLALYNPNGGVFITIRQPDGSVHVTQQLMTLLRTGYFTYRLQTTPLDPPGVWQSLCRTVHNGETTTTEFENAFALITA